MACWNKLVLLLTVFVVADEAFAKYNFVVAPISENLTHIRQYRDTEKHENVEVRSLHIDSLIKYRYANTVVLSKIANRANKAKEIRFTTILPDSAFITGFAITINGTVYKAYVKDKEEAKKIYHEAVSGGRTAGHVELSARDSNTFRVSVNIEAQGKVSFNLTYEELLSRKLGTYKHKISLNPGQIVTDMRIRVFIQESSNITILRVPKLRESNEIMGNDITENTHVTKKQPKGNTAIISWTPSPDQQREINRGGVKGLLEVLYDVDRTSQSNQILVNDGYFVHYFAPADLIPLHKHVVFILDRSGSMSGRKIEQLKEAMKSILDELRAGDSFSLILFAGNVEVWLSNGQLVKPGNRHGKPLSSLAIVEATQENIQAAKRLVNRISPTTTTDIYSALQTGLRLVRQRLERDVDYKEPMMILLTDGRPVGRISDPERIIRDITANNQDLSAVIYGLAFGNDADFRLLKKLSLKNFGFARKIYEASDASLQLKNFYQEVSSPILSNVNFNYPEDQVNVNSLTKLHFRTHNKGSEIAVAGKLLNTNALTAEVRGRSVNGLLEVPMCPSMEVIDNYPRTPVIQNASEAGFMERLWAYLTIKQLLDLKEATGNTTVEQEALQLALKYSFVTPLTSLVVVKPNDMVSGADFEATEVDDGEDNSTYIHNERKFTISPRIGSSAEGYGEGGFYGSSIGLGGGRFILPNSSAVAGGGGGHEYGSESGTGGHSSQSSSSGTSSQRLGTSTRITMPSPSTGENVVPLSSYSWFSQVSNDTHMTILVAGVTETLKIGYNETNVQFNTCSVGLVQSHCRHLPHCSLSKFSQDIDIYRSYFCKINNFIGVCCPDHIPLQGTTTV